MKKEILILEIREGVCVCVCLFAGDFWALFNYLETDNTGFLYCCNFVQNM